MLPRLVRNKKEYVMLAFILLIGIFSRVYHFGIVPYGINQDEASIGYEAYSISNYGIDRNGMHNPVHIIAWGSGQSALYPYLSIPFIKLLGLNIISVRLANLVFGLISLLMFYLLGKKITNNKIALIATFLLSISPWHVMLSRWGLDCNIFPAFFLIGVYLLIASCEREIYLPFSFAFFAISLYAYGTAFFIVPMFILFSSAYIFFHKKVLASKIFISLAIFLIIAAPILLFIFINSSDGSSIKTPFFTIPKLTVARYSQVSILSAENLAESLASNLKNLISLIFTQTDGNSYNSMQPYGIFYLFSLPFALIGLFVVVTQTWKLRTFSKSFFILLWFVISVILGAIMPVNINRLNIIFLPLIFFTALGIFELKSKETISLVILLYLVSFGFFIYDYHHRMPGFIDPDFDKAVQRAAEVTSGAICIAPRINMPYIYVLFDNKVDPNIFINTVKYANPGGEFQYVLSFDRYVFGMENCLKRNEISAYVVDIAQATTINQTSHNTEEYGAIAVVWKNDVY